MDDMDRDRLEFAIFCVENVGLELNLSGAQVYELLTKKTSILTDYIIPNFETLHTQSKEYIVADIIEFMQSEGVLK